MSTIKSSAEDLTLNADGSNEVKFQINAVEKASINSSGLLTSTNIDATVLTGNLPAISGASLTSLNASNLGSGTVADARLGTVPVNKGGTGATTHTANNVLVGNGTSAIGSVAPSTSGNVLTSNGSSWASTAPAASGSTFTTVSTVSTASGTIHDIATSLPSGICQFTVSMDAVEASGTTSNNFIIQLGDSGGYETTGYTSGTIRIDSGTDNFYSTTEGMVMIQNGGAEVIRAVWLFTKHGTGNTWAMNNVATSYAVTNIIASAGTKTLSGELTQIRLTTYSSHSTFSGGTVACQYTVA